MREMRLPCLKGAEQLPEPGWKEKKRLGDGLEEGYRLICQFWINHDIELEQDKIRANPGTRGLRNSLTAANRPAPPTTMRNLRCMSS